MKIHIKLIKRGQLMESCTDMTVVYRHTVHIVLGSQAINICVHA